MWLLPFSCHVPSGSPRSRCSNRASTGGSDNSGAIAHTKGTKSTKVTKATKDTHFHGMSLGTDE